MEKLGNSVWKVYIPHALLDSKKGFLYGHIVPRRHFICLVEIKQEDISDVDQSLRDDTNRAICLGFWHGSKAMSNKSIDTHTKLNVNLACNVWIDLSPSHSMAPLCRLQISEEEGLNFVEKNVICIIYNAKDLLSSYLLRDAINQLCVKKELLNPKCELSNLDILVYFLHHHSKCDSVLERQAKVARDCLLVKDDSEHSFITLIIFYITSFLCWIYFALGKIVNNRVFNGDYLKEAVNHIAFFHQIDLRYLQVQQILKMTRYEDFQEIRKQNILTRLLLDTIFGIGLMVLLMNTGAADIMAYYIITWADSVLIWLNNLLDWLMGVPAGLKLNSQLDQFLGRFFHYHIYLWTGYLTLLKPILAPLLWYSSIVGVLGISTQLCLLQDIFTTLTVHIYCFYVYAARLYYFQLYGLSSLWRLFRGKKWNVLRRRVDSASYDVDQLFVGTLLFTILLFLLPTTALYYVVFLGLRLLVLSLTGVVSKIVSLINTLPLHGLLLRLFCSSKITGDIMLTVLPEQPINETLCVSMQTIQVPYSNILGLLREETKSLYKQPSYTWGSLIRRVFVGELIYPWVEPGLGSP